MNPGPSSRAGANTSAPIAFRIGARERGIKITLADLVPFAFNLAHRPYSWFDFFAKRGVPADVFDKWKEVDDSMVRHTYIEASKDGAPADIAEKWKEAAEFSQGRWVPDN
jgi:hypothetical protein